MATRHRPSRGSPLRLLVRYAVAALLGLGVGAAAYLIFGVPENRSPVPVEPAAPSGSVAIGGSFDLVDQNGQRRTDKDFRGRFMLVYFGYTYCPDVCPTALQTMSDALDLLGKEGKRIQPVFITIDPERDTADQLKAYVANFHPRLVALTGTPQQVAAAAKAYRVYFAKADSGADGDYLMDHSSFIYLMGPDGRLVTYFRHGLSADDMAARLRKYL